MKTSEVASTMRRNKGNSRKSSSAKILPKELLTPIRLPKLEDPYTFENLLEVGGEGHAAKVERAKKVRLDRRNIMVREAAKKFALLLNHFETPNSNDDDGWALELLSKVCSEFVPGFRVVDDVSHRGRPRKWDSQSYAELWVDVESTKKNFNLRADRDALALLAANSPRYGSTKQKITTSQKNKAIDSLEARLSEAKRPEHNKFANFLSNLLNCPNGVSAASEVFNATLHRK